MIHRTALFLLLFVAVLHGARATGCTPAAVQVQATAADAIARAANPALVTLAETYARQGELLIESAHSREEALALLDAHRLRWRGVWDAVDALGAAHSAWAHGLETGMTSAETVAEVRAAWCELDDAAEGVDVQLPEAIKCP